MIEYLRARGMSILPRFSFSPSTATPAGPRSSVLPPFSFSVATKSGTYSSSSSASASSSSSNADLSAEEKRSLVDRILKCEITKEEALAQCGNRVTRKLLNKWIRKAKRGEVVKEAGRPRTIDAEREKRLLADVKSRDDDKDSADAKDLKEMVMLPACVRSFSLFA